MLRSTSPGSRSRTWEGPLALLVDALAVYRLVKLVRDDRITEVLRRETAERFGPPDTSKVAYLLHCPWCLSFWFALALTLARRRWPTATHQAARVLALSATTGLAVQHLED